jgi:hypothetical protein
VEAADEKANEKKGKGKEKGKEKKGKGSGPGQKTHQLRRSAFSAYQFQIIGNKHMLHAMIRTPLSSVAQSTVQLQDFINNWQEYKQKREHQKTVQDNDKKPEKWIQLKATADKTCRRFAEGKSFQKQILQI